jgi:hypothetical protein
MKMNKKEKEKRLTCGPKDTFNISWASFSFGLPVVSCHHSVMLPPYSTHNPPHEQWLVRLGVGGVSHLHRLTVI